MQCIVHLGRHYGGRECPHNDPTLPVQPASRAMTGIYEQQQPLTIASKTYSNFDHSLIWDIVWYKLPFHKSVVNSVKGEEAPCRVDILTTCIIAMSEPVFSRKVPEPQLHVKFCVLSCPVLARSVSSQLLADDTILKDKQLCPGLADNSWQDYQVGFAENVEQCHLESLLKPVGGGEPDWLGLGGGSTHSIYALHYTTLHYTILHYTTLHYTTLQCRVYTTLHSTTQCSTLVVSLHHTTLH